MECTWHRNIIFPTRTIVHPFMDVTTVTEVLKLLEGVYNKNQTREAIHWCPIFLTGSDDCFILDEIKRRDTI